MTTHCYRNEPTCPHCDQVVPWVDDDGPIVECPHCERHFVVTVHKTMKYTTAALTPNQRVASLGVRAHERGGR